VSVDGTHCPVNEPAHPTLPKDKAYYSEKFNRSALSYELGIDLYQSRVVSCTGPIKAGTPDIEIFRMHLTNLIPPGHLCIADKGYRGEHNQIAIANAYDPPDLRNFKTRSRARQETFNARLKAFDVLKYNFRHQIHKHKTCFDAVLVVCQLSMENGSPLFDN
jgi:hypothetical protein